ncbi:MAG: hypothetical protein SF028_05105 [Candidatus Sumerlaeia bacterium]|nr:hypothetical protein [Candidatus Sumerlaeia bacterium]
MKRALLTTVASLAALLAPFSAAATVVAADDAGQSTYNSGFDPGMDGGTGFGPWTITQEASSGRFVGDSTTNGFTGGGGINSGTTPRAWGLYANTGTLATASRTLDAPLVAGGAIRMSIDSGFVAGGGVVGFNIRNSSDQDLFQLRFAGGDASWKKTDAGGDADTGNGFSSDGFDLVLRMTSATTYSATFTKVGDAVGTPFTGTFSNPAGGQSATIIRFYNFNAGSGSTNDMFFNKLEVEEPPLASVSNWEAYE